MKRDSDSGSKVGEEGDAFTWSGRTAAVTLAIVALVYLVGLGRAGVIDYDEAVYADVTRRMLDRGDLLIPVSGEGESAELESFVESGAKRIDVDALESPWFEKPPLVYWTQALGASIFGVQSPWGVRFFNALAGVALVAAIGAFARRALGARAAFIAVVIAATSLELIALSRVALTDVWLVLFLFVGVSFAGLADRAWVEHRRGWGLWIAGCAFGGLAVLSKGLVGLVLPGAAFVAYAIAERRLVPFLRPTWLVPGLLVSGLIGGSWYLAVGSTHGWTFLQELFLEQHVGRFGKPIHGHDGPVVYYIPVVIAGLLPWSVFAGLVVRQFRQRSRDSVDAGTRFLRLHMLFAGITFVFFSLAATKLPSYIGPVFPAFVLVLAAAWAKFESEEWRPFERRAARGAAIALGGLAIVLSVLPLVDSHLPEWIGDDAKKQPGLAHLDITFETSFSAAALAIGALLVWRAASRPRELVVRIGGTLAAFTITAALFVLPVYERSFLAPLRTAAEVADAALESDGSRQPIVLVGVKHVPSVSRATGRETVYASKRVAAMREQLPVALASAGERGFVGIVSEGYVDRLAEVVEFEELTREMGWIVVRATRLRPAPDNHDSGRP